MFKTKVFLTLTLLMLIGLTLIISCTPSEEELPFETIEQAITPPTGGYDAYYKGRQPNLTIITDDRAVDQLTGITAEARSKLKTLNYGSHFALVIFLGLQSTDHTGIRIERLIRHGDKALITTWVGKQELTDKITSPYHLIKIQKKESWGKEIDFEAIADKTTIVTATRYIP